MKNLTIFIFLTFLTLNIHGQRLKGDWTVGLGVNFVNNTGAMSPLNSPDDWAFKNPFSASVEYNISEIFAFEQSLSFNKFTNSTVIDSRPITENLSFFSTNTKFKWYFDDYIFYRNNYWFDFAATTGLGIFQVDGETNTSFNFGIDGNVWIDDNWGIALKSLAKFAFDTQGVRYISNHFQFFIEVLYKL